MKTKLGVRIVMLLAACLMILAGCSKKQYTSADFVGVWDSDFELGSETIEFCSDGTFNKVLNSSVGELYLTGTYSVAQDKVTVSFDQTGGTDEYDFKFVDNNTMVWTLTDMEEVEFTYIRK